MIADYLRNDTALLLLVTVGVLVRYLPQARHDIANRKRKVLRKKTSIIRPWHIFCLYVCIYAVFLLRAGHYPDSLPVVVLGSFVFVLGFTVGLAALLSLSWQYNEELVCYEGATLVTHGIYSIVRHPVRAGMFCELLGMTILAGAPLLLLPLTGVLIFQYVRTRDEEALLREFFGEAQDRYIAAVPRFNLPYGFLKAWCRNRAGRAHTKTTQKNPGSNSKP